MRILVTGWSGFIGRALTFRLIERYGAAALIGVARAPASAAEREAVARATRAGMRLIEADLCGRPPSAESIPPVDVVFHLAANIDTEAPASAMAVNDQGTANLLDWIGSALGGARVVYTSSVAVMDRTGPAAGPLDETSACTPRTAYGSSKLRGEDVLREAAPRLDFTYTILRLPTVYGPGQKAGGMFDLLAGYAARGALVGRVDWPGRTSVIFVDDLAEAMIDLATRPEAADRLLCVSSGEEPPVGVLARAVARATGHRIRPLHLPAWLWSGLRVLVWVPGLSTLVPPRARVAFWRLTLIVDHGFWFDSSRFRALYTKDLTPLEEGLRRTFSVPTLTSSGSRPTL